MAPPIVVLGVRRSGTTLLRVMLDRNPELAIPDESFFLPQLADRHRGRIDPERFVDDLRRLPAIREWGIPLDSVRSRLWAGSTLSDAIRAVYEIHAAQHGKERWGDKTPAYMEHLGLLERLLPDAQYVHLIRDGRDAAVSYAELPPGVAAATRVQPRSHEEFACAWRTEIAAARSLGRRVGPRRYFEARYEALVAEPETVLRAICAFAALPYDATMLDYPGRVDVARKPHQTRLTQAPTPGLRDWRTDMSPADVARFDRVAGDLLADLGYQPAGAAAPPGRRARVALAAYRVRVVTRNAAATAFRRSPLWRRRHPPLV